MAATLTMAECEALNDRARAIQRECNCDAQRALLDTASEAGLEDITPEDQQGGEDALIFQAPEGRLVNCWLVGAASGEIEEMGAGFDDQVERYAESRDEEADPHQPSVTESIQVPIYTCQRCGHKWTSRILTTPKRCPNCKDARWQEPYIRPRKEKASS